MQVTVDSNRRIFLPLDVFESIQVALKEELFADADDTFDEEYSWVQLRSLLAPSYVSDLSLR